MPRYVINVTSNGTRLFSTSRSSIGDDKQKLARLVNLFDVLVNGAPDEEGMAIQVVRIADHAAETCTLKGVPLSQLPQPMGPVFGDPFAPTEPAKYSATDRQEDEHAYAPFGNASGDTGADPRIAQVATLKNRGWYEHAEGGVALDAEDGTVEFQHDTWDGAIRHVFGETIGVVTLKEEAHAVALSSAQIGEAKGITLAELADHPVGKANAASWAQLSKKPA